MLPCVIICSKLFEINKWISKLTWLFPQFLALHQHICSPAQPKEMHTDRKQNLSWPGTLCSSLCSNVLTDRHMKSESRATQSLVLQARAKPAVGSYGVSYVSTSLSPYAASLPTSRHAAPKALYQYQITPAEVLHFSVPVQWSIFPVHWMTTGFSLYI